MIDLRSDTVTKPTAAMREAMACAEVGDDVYGDDTTVNRLQDVLAERAGSEAGLFFPSGTQCNLAALLTHCQRGDEYLVGLGAHTYVHEGGGAAVLGSIQPQPLENERDGSISLARIVQAIKPPDDHYARTRLLSLENTFGGRVVPHTYLREATTLAHARGLATHLDGARVFNAVVKTKTPLNELLRGFDSVSICLSKGLGAPVGSVLLGTRAYVREARRWRKMLGGGMRQAGVLAAAGLYALDHHVERLAEDHENATALAKGLSEIDGLTVEMPQTNIVWVDVVEPLAQRLVPELKKLGVLASGTTKVRFVTHLDVNRQQVDHVISACRRIRAAA
ncbi:MAG: low-specificity L-threonine aldolase [Archangium gephyra]|uniref:Low-specificity L-threonine aldolase n=1 Tax=Archangium gephyra TaxID=48 RepID=A0A2W5VWE3_9BACT|nr:MAG: low-specificity L-threonine aldolase [Archangium gephyra]